jgi:predicted component of type VI protein secretion system
MAKLIVKLNNDVLDHIEIKQGDMKVGRKPGCDVVLDNLAVSGEHANIFTIGDDSFIQDLNSTNGTFINNKRITKHHLHNGDQVVIGKHTLVYFTDQPTATERPTEEFAKTVIINPTRVEPAAPPRAPAARPAVAPPAPAPKPQQHVGQGSLVIVGSNKRLDLVKNVTSIGKTGKRSGTITRHDDGYVLQAGDDEPIKLNGRPVTHEGTRLKNGDIIDVGGTRLQFYQK